MRESRPQLLNTLFDDTFTANKGMLHSVQQRAVVLLKLNLAVKRLLSSRLHPWCRVANYRQSVLVLETANAHWMMQLRYEQTYLLSTLRAQILPSLSSIDIRINPSLMVKRNNFAQDATKISQNTVTGKSTLTRHLSLESAKRLKGLASHSPERMRNILEQLAALANEREH